MERSTKVVCTISWNRKVPNWRVLFWEDLWGSGVLALKYPCLFSFARDQRISVKNVMEVHDLASLFALPLSEQAHDELQAMQNELLSVPFDDDQKDIWTLTWGS